VDQQALAEYRYRAVREVLGGSAVGEVAERYGTTRQSLHAWRKRFEAEGMPGLADRSRRPKSSPSRVDAGIEALICRLRREHPRWGARRIGHELSQRGVAAVPGPGDRAPGHGPQRAGQTAGATARAQVQAVAAGRADAAMAARHRGRGAAGRRPGGQDCHGDRRLLAVHRGLRRGRSPVRARGHRGVRRGDAPLRGCRSRC
jgi:transposase